VAAGAVGSREKTQRGGGREQEIVNKTKPNRNPSKSTLNEYFETKLKEHRKSKSINVAKT